MLYKKEFLWLCEDLLLDPAEVRVNWIPRKNVARHSVGAYYPDSKLVQIAMRQPYPDLISTLAHELRHYAQFHRGWARSEYPYGNDGNLYIHWLGTELVPFTDAYVLTDIGEDPRRYIDQPHEVDARLYQVDACARMPGSVRLGEDRPRIALAGLFD